MKQQTLAILTVVAVIVVGVVYIVQPNTEQTFNSQGALFSGLKENLATVNQLKINVAGPTVVADIKRLNQQWVVASKNNFPAEFDKVLQLLTELSEAVLLEAKTKKSEFYDRLGVEGVGTDQSSIQVQIFLEGRESPFEVLIGKPLDNNAGQYVRLVNDDQSWLIDRTLVLYNAAEEWLSREIIDIDIDRIKEIEFTDPDGKIITANKEQAEDENFTIKNIPENRELIYQSIGNSLANAVAGLRLEDVYLLEEMPLSEEDRVFVSKFITFDGLRVEVKSVQRDDQYLITLNLAIQANDGEPLDENKTSKVQQEIDQLANRVNNWIFSVSEANYTSLTKTMEDLLKSPSSDETPNENN